ncbi:hypothetical protein CsSME_00011197 [Camellia sinensis var. sinensis]
MERQMPTEGRRDEENGGQIGGPANGCQFPDAEQRHVATVPATRYADSSGQERCPERGAENGSCSPSAWRDQGTFSPAFAGGRAWRIPKDTISA